MSRFDLDKTNDFLSRFYDARDEGMDHETGYDFAHPLADELSSACAYIRKLEAVRDAAQQVANSFRPFYDEVEKPLVDALATLDEDNK